MKQQQQLVVTMRRCSNECKIHNTQKEVNKERNQSLAAQIERKLLNANMHAFIKAKNMYMYSKIQFG
jgi:hypothetical protein